MQKAEATEVLVDYMCFLTLCLADFGPNIACPATADRSCCKQLTSYRNTISLACGLDYINAAG